MRGDLANDIQAFLEKNGPSTSMEIKSRMKELGYPKQATASHLAEMKQRGEVNQRTDEDGNPVNKYEVAVE